jgi:hypothetical protein
MKILAVIVPLFFIVACSSTRKISRSTPQESISQLRFLGEYVLPSGQTLKNTVVGGLSGIDYDAKRDLYYMICDDPSSKGPTRYYTAQIRFTEKGIDTVALVDMTPLLDRAGHTFSDITKDRFHSADVEALRYDARRDEMIWSSEGQRYIRDGKQELQDPQIVIMDRQGHFRDSFELPANLHIQAIEKGPRHNSVFEGIAFDADYVHVFVSVEEPLYEDGPRAGGGDSTAWVRILKFNRQLKQCVAQYAYRIDPVPFPATPPGAFKINGVSDILGIGHNRFLIVERGYSVGRRPSNIRVYLADANGAEDITSVSLDHYQVKRPINKKLLINMDSLGRFVDNIEGVTFGPKLPNGHSTLLFVADDNFASYQKSQFFLFEVIP